MPSLSPWVRLLPGVQVDFLDGVKSLDARHAELERRIASLNQELAELHQRLADSRSRIENLIAKKWTTAQLLEAKAAAAPSESDRLSSAASADLCPSSSTAQN